MARGGDGKLQRLRSVYLFSRCSEKELKRIASIADEVEFGSGHVLCGEGDRSLECFLIIEGEAVVRQGDRVLRTVGPGESIGEMGLLNHAPRSATVVTTTPMSAYVIDSRRFGKVLDDTPTLTRALLDELSHRLRTLDVSYREQPTG